MPADPYARVYFRFIDDHPAVYEDDRLLAAWLRLLMAAEGAYPASASIPRWCKTATIERLAKEGVVDLLPGDRYRIHGLAKERERRTKQARDAANARWGRGDADASDGRNADPDADAYAVAPEDASDANMLDETRRDEQRQDEGRQAAQRARGTALADASEEEPEFPARQWLAQHGVSLREGNGFHQALILVTERFGIEAVLAELEELSASGVQDGDDKGFVFGVKDGLFRRSRFDAQADARATAVAADRAAQAEEKAERERLRLERVWNEMAQMSPELREKHYPGEFAHLSKKLGKATLQVVS
jgi:hypothetical protein